MNDGRSVGRTVERRRWGGGRRAGGGYDVQADRRVTGGRGIDCLDRSPQWPLTYRELITPRDPGVDNVARRRRSVTTPTTVVSQKNPIKNVPRTDQELSKRRKCSHSCS